MAQPAPAQMAKQPPENMKTEDTTPDLKTIRDQIPPHCFESSLTKSMSYVVRDLILTTLLLRAALWIPLVDDLWMRVLLWSVYGFVQGLVFTGIWILAHECGHDSFSRYKTFNAGMGFFLHSIILVPFFSWKYSHSRHHRYTNHMEKDTVFSPSTKDTWRTSWWTGSFLGHGEDAPLPNVLMLLAHQLFGWPVYILFNAGAGSDSLVAPKTDSKISRSSHLDPGAWLFRSDEHPFVLLSDIGLLGTFTALWYASTFVGVYNVCLLYGVPYLWMNHWLVAITYLHHTHPNAPHYEGSEWTYKRGALSTIDRDFGLVGRHLFHGIIEYHVIHHMFPRIPFYHAEEATKAIAPLLGNSYIEERNSFLYDLWKTFTTCSYVVESKSHQGWMYWVKAGAQ